MFESCFRRGAVLPLILAAWASAGGCNRGPAMVQVRGKVLYQDGSVIKRGVREISFQPTQDTTAVMRKTGIGKIQDDGSFELFTRKTGDGVLLGKYAVVISVMRGERDPVQLIAAKYTTSATTPYHETVEHEMTDLLYTVEPVTAGTTGNPTTNAATVPTGPPGDK
jgi:hypothetical protein